MLVIEVLRMEAPSEFVQTVRLNRGEPRVSPVIVKLHPDEHDLFAVSLPRLDVVPYSIFACVAGDGGELTTREIDPVPASTAKVETVCVVLL